MKKHTLQTMHHPHSFGLASDTIAYRMNLRSFTPEGTLNAAARRLEHIADLGVNMLILEPISQMAKDVPPEKWTQAQTQYGMGNPNNPFLVTSFAHVDEEYGTDADFAAFTHLAHQLGMSVFLSLNVSFCSPDAPFLADHPDYRKEDPEHAPTVAILDLTKAGVRKIIQQQCVELADGTALDGFLFMLADWLPVDFFEELREKLDETSDGFLLIADSITEDDMPEALDAIDSSVFAHELSSLLNSAEGRAEQWAEFLYDANENTHCALPALLSLDTFAKSTQEYPERETAQRPIALDDIGIILLFMLNMPPVLMTGQEFADSTPVNIFTNRNYGRLFTDWSCLATADGRQRLELVRKLIDLRLEKELFHDDTCIFPIQTSQPESVIAFLRTTDDECEDGECECEDGECNHAHYDNACYCDEHEECDDEDDDEYDDGCDCDECSDDPHGSDTEILFVANLSEKPVSVVLEYGVPRGTIWRTLLEKGVDIHTAEDATTVHLLPYGYAIIEF